MSSFPVFPGFPPNRALPVAPLIRLDPSVNPSPLCGESFAFSCLPPRSTAYYSDIPTTNPNHSRTYATLRREGVSFLANIRSSNPPFFAPLTPLDATLTDSSSAKSFSYHSYGKQWGVGAHPLAISAPPPGLLSLPVVAAPPPSAPGTSAPLHPALPGATMAASWELRVSGKHFLPLRCLILRADKGWPRSVSQPASQ
jgi:hypothetical protein